MEVTLKQGVFRFILLSRINELMQHREIVISSVKDSLISKLTPKTSSEITAGSSANVNPKLIKEVDEILSELNVFALTGGDSERRAGSESTASSEISSDNYVANLVSQTIILKSVLGFLSEDANDTTATDLQNSFNSYLDISREIASWSMYLNQMRNNTTVAMGGSSLSLLMKNWGPVGLSEDMEDKYNRLYDHIYFLSLSGKVKALLDSDSVGVKVKQVEEEYSFDQAGAVTISIPPDADFNYIDFLCKVDYVIRTSKIDSYVDLGYDVSYDFGSNSFTVTITTVDGKPACQVEIVDPPLPDNPPPFPPPPIVPPLPSPPVPQPPSDCLPLALSFVIDFSGSMVDYSRYGASKGIIQWIDLIMKNSSQGGVTYSDYASIVKFSGRRKNYTNINISQYLTDDKGLLRQAVQNPYSSMDKTPIWDACMVSMKALIDQVSDIPNYSLYNLVLILFTDGCDNISVATPNDVIAYAVENNIMIFSIGMVNRFQGYTFFEETNIKRIAEDVDGEYRKLDQQTFNPTCDICDNTCYSQVCPSCDASCDNEGCSLCNFTCYGQVCTTCHNQHYAVTCATCDSACYQEICYYCHNTSYSRCSTCDRGCYSQEGCTVCNSECYSERCRRCDNVCYTDQTGCSVCDATCYSEQCSTCYSCYAEEQCQSCDNTCYGDSCNCNTTCYGYSSCTSCNSTCYSYIDGVCIQEQDSGSCSCNATGYGSNRCTCNNTCYNQQCTECHGSFYGDTTCRYCHNTCYSDISGCTVCNNECYGEHCYHCHVSVYDYNCSHCHMSCYSQTCICNNTCYGEHCSACDHTCYGECTICDEACYLQTCQTCDGSCYQGNVCNTCDNTCNLERCTSCHNSCYSSYESTDIYDTYKETISSACDIVKIKAEKTVANFSANIIEGSNPLTVIFTDSSTGSVYGYSWSFGNGDTSTVKNPPAVTYTDVGVYAVRLKTTGLIPDYDDEEVKEAYIKVWTPQAAPVAAFQANVVEGDVPLLVQFSDQTTGYYSIRKMDFGDGNVQIQTNPELLTAKFFNRHINHVYQSIGTYTVKLSVSGPGGSDSVTRTAYIDVIECEPISSGKLKVGYTLIEKYNIPNKKGIIYYKLDFTVKNWTIECMPDCVNLSAINPEGIIPIAIVDLKYTALSGSGVTAIPIKVGESVPWAPSGFLRGEITYTRSGDTKVNLSFRAKTTFPDPGDPTIITAPEIGSYTFTEANNILGIEDTNSIVRLIKFEVPEGSSSVTYTVGQICNIINNVFDEEVIALPDKFGKLVLFTKRGEYLRIVGIDKGSTANSVFGFYEFGEINTPNYGSEVEYTVTLYLVGVLVGNTIDSSLSPTLQEYKEHKIIHGTMEFNSYNWYQDRYGKIPPEIGGSLFTTPGHRILGIGGITLTKVEAFEDPIYSKTNNIDDSGVLPYWEDMKVGSVYNNDKYNIWNLGDDKRFFTRTFLDLSDSIYCIMGNYKFMAPGPVLPYRLTALITGPYDLGDANSCDKTCYPGESESRNRFIAIRKVALDGVNGTDWYFIELPYGILTASEIISTMQRDNYQIIGSIATYSPTNITMTTALLDQNGYLVIGRNEGSLTTDIKFEDVGSKLRISIPNDSIYGIRLGGAPELVFANEIFGWNTLGEFGDPVSNAFYYKYTYEVDAYIDTSAHPSSGYKQTLIPEGTNLSKYAVVLNAADVDKSKKIEAVYLNLLATIFDPKLVCLDGERDLPILDGERNLPIVDDDEYYFVIPPCEPVTFTELTVNVPCDVNIICDQEFPFIEITDLISQITNDPLLQEFGLAMQLGNPADVTHGKDRMIKALNYILDTDYINDPEATSSDGFAIEVASNVVSLPVFSTDNLLVPIETLISNIQSKWAIDYFGVVKDIAQFIVSYVTLYNSGGAVDGIKYQIPIVSNIYWNCTTFTIAKYSMVNYAVDAIRSVLECQLTKQFTCVEDKTVIVYPVAIDTLDGSAHTSDSIRIEYCSYNLNEKVQVTVTMTPVVNSMLVGVITEKDTDDLVAIDFPYSEFDISGDPFDSTGEVTPLNTYEFILPINSIPIYFTINDKIQTGIDSLIKEVTWYPKLNKLNMVLCGITESQLVLTVEDCIILKGTEVYVFNTNIHDEDIVLDLRGRSKIMLDELLKLIQSIFQPLTVTLSEDETTITIGGDAVVINIVSEPTINVLEAYIDYEDFDYDLSIKVYYGYFNISEDVDEGSLVSAVSPAVVYPNIVYEDEDSTEIGSSGSSGSSI